MRGRYSAGDYSITSATECGKRVCANDIAPAGTCQDKIFSANRPACTAGSAPFNRRASSGAARSTVRPLKSGSSSGPAASTWPCSCSVARWSRCASCNAAAAVSSSCGASGRSSSNTTVNSSNSIPLCERLARFQQGLEPADDAHPARPRDACRRPRCALELVVDDRQQTDAVLARLDLPRDPARLLGGQLGVPLRAPAVDKPPRRVELEDLVFARHA